ncbi:hypothetical protein K440DRAFT_551521, partial [Wilcoxina mikolae CBS 423.85]
TALFSLPFSAYFLLLSQRVVSTRQKTDTTFGTTSSSGDSNDPLFVAIRAHANFLETVPVGLLLALTAEINGANRKVLCGALAGLWVLRVANVEAGLRRSEAKGFGRFMGYFGTQVWLGGMTVWCVHLTRDFWGF